jgi:hypothetical protein
MDRKLDACTQETFVIAWISHHLPIDGKLIGGAEMSDDSILKDAPVKIDVITPGNWEQAMSYDEIIITGTDLLSPYAMNQLAQKKPVVAIHHLQTHSAERALLISSAKVFVARTPRHLELELTWTSPSKKAWVLSPLKPSEMSVKPKEDFALWAARMHPQKGPVEAQAWADERGIPLVMMTDKPRSEVLETMSRAKHFVLLPNGFDAEPRAIIEAVISGCEVHTNELAGITSVPNWRDPETLSELVSNAKDLFWQTVLD